MIEAFEQYYQNMKGLNLIITQYKKLYAYYDKQCDLESYVKDEIISKDMYNKLDTRYY